MGGSTSTPLQSVSIRPAAQHSFYQIFSLDDETVIRDKFGQVRNVISLDGGHFGTVRIIDARKHDDSGTSDHHIDGEAQRLLKVWWDIGHCKHCVGLCENFFEGNIYYLVSKRLTRLTDALSTPSQVAKGDVTSLFTGMLLGIKHLHDRRIVHRDIKLDSFLCNGVDTASVKLGDFGSAAFLPVCGHFGGSCGDTAPYMSPELVAARSYGLPTDLWSFGVVMFLLIYGDFPYAPVKGNVASTRWSIEFDESRVRWATGSKYTGPFVLDVLDGANLFLDSALQRSPEKRMTVQEALKHPYLHLGPLLKGQSAFKSAAGTAPLAEACRKALEASSEQHELCPALAKIQPALQERLDDVLLLYQTQYAEVDVNPKLLNSAFQHLGWQEHQEEEEVLGRRRSSVSTAMGVTISALLGGAQEKLLGAAVRRPDHTQKQSRFYKKRSGILPRTDPATNVAWSPLVPA